MTRITLTGFGLALLAATLGTLPAEAQTVYYRNQQPQPLLVAPDGAILDYMPDRRNVIISRDGMGRRVYLDRYGNIIATEVRRDAYQPAPVDRYPPPPGGNRYDDGSQQNGGYRDYRTYRSDGQYANDGQYGNGGQYGNNDYGNSGQYGSEPGAVTGSVQRPGSITRLPLDNQNQNTQPSYNQTMPNNGNYPQEASIGDDANQPPPNQPGPGSQPSSPTIPLKNQGQAQIAALQTFLDREGISPGVIDGHMGDNVTKAIAAWQEMTGETLDPNNSEDIMQRLTYSGGLPVVNYTITAADAAGPYVAAIPEDYAHKAQLPAMSYTSVTEKLAEQFHMDEGYLKQLNPGADFTVPGTTIKVINPGPNKSGEVTRIVADKGRKQVFAYGADGKLISAYPATIGSTDTPSPTGTHTVQRIAFDPGYTYNPKINFKQGDNDQILQIPPGPNGPVGSVWIALSKPTYGIHGTPEPSKIGKSSSHGCVRLTNWDATELAKMVKPGTTVEFVE